MKKDASLELLDKLLENEDKPKKKRGRPPKVTVKTKSPIEEEEVDEILEEVITSHSQLKYVTWAEFIELGEPRWGYTTAKIKQYKVGSPEYYETILTYYRLALLYSKLTKTIGWYEKTGDYELELCRKEIDEFCKSNSITSHDLGEIISLCYNAEHKRKLLTRQLKDVAKEVLEHRKTLELKKPEKERQTLHIREIAEIPQNIRPTLKYVIECNSDINVEEIVNEALAEFTDNPTKRKQHACTEHLFYKGLRKPRNSCPLCFEYYNWNKKQGIKESRNK